MMEGKIVKNGVLEGQEDSSWSSGDIDRLSICRDDFRDLTGAIVQKTLKECITPNDKNLEVGSGMGQLVKLVPEFANTILQTDGSAQMVEKRQESGEQVQQVDARDLSRYMKEQFHNVLGLGCMDVMLEDIDKVMNEIRRVLKPGGKCIHFLDIIADHRPLMKKLMRDYPNMIPFPIVEGADGERPSLGFQMVEKERAAKVFFKKLNDPNIIKTDAELMGMYAQNPEVCFHGTGLLGDIGRLKYLGDLVQAWCSPRETYFVNEYFDKQLRSAMERNGFRIVEELSGLKEKKLVTKDREEGAPNSHIFHVGYLVPSKEDRHLRMKKGRKAVQWVSRVMVIVGEKT